MQWWITNGIIAWQHLKESSLYIDSYTSIYRVQYIYIDLYIYIYIIVYIVYREIDDG